MQISVNRYTAEDVDCKLCTEYPCGVPECKAVCPWLAERIGAGVVGYGEAARGSVSIPGWKSPSSGFPAPCSGTRDTDSGGKT